MAKSPHAVITRIATTVTARYYPSSGAVDGFYLDGRISGRREHRAADITLDRESRGSFFSVFAHLAGNGSDDAVQARVRKALDRVHFDLNESNRNIDSEINDLAECAVSVAGRITLHHEGVRQPYFAGICVKDAEIAAVTMGGGCAFLYRGDVLYPLTADDSQLEAIDSEGKPVKGLDVYCAGVAGTVRYSNIAQLQMDDCLVVCNREVIEALGQRELLRMLDEAEDQADAAGMIMTAASAKLPGVPLQFMIGFVESVSSASKQGRMLSGKSLPGAAGLGALASKRQGRSEQPVKQPETLPEEDEDIFDEDDGASALEAAEDGYNDLDDYDEYDQTPRSGRGRRLAFYLIVAAICIACIFAIYNMLWPGGDTDETTEPTASTILATTILVTESQDPAETSSETASPSETDGTNAATTVQMQQYTVQSGDTYYSISIQFYGEYSEAYAQLIRDANELTGEYLQVGQVLNIPDKP